MSPVLTDTFLWCVSVHACVFRPNDYIDHQNDALEMRKSQNLWVQQSGTLVGAAIGDFVGAAVGEFVGAGPSEGSMVPAPMNGGSAVGEKVGGFVGVFVGDIVGASVGGQSDPVWAIHWVKMSAT